MNLNISMAHGIPISKNNLTLRENLERKTFVLNQKLSKLK